MKNARRARWRDLSMFKFILCALLLAAAAPGSAAGSEGVSGAQFLRIGVGAREAALGDTGATVSGAQSLFYNPAGLSDLAGTELALSQVKWVMDVNYSNLAAAKSFGAGVFGLSVNYLSMPRLEKYDKLGNKLDAAFSAADMAAGIGYGAKLTQRLGCGLNARYVSSSLDDKTASAMAFDAGLKYAVVRGVLNVGAALQNLGTKLKFSEESSSLPLNLKLGAEYVLSIDSDADLPKKISFYADVNQLKDSGVSGSAGIEFLSAYRDGSLFSFRGGYRTNAGDKSSGASLGLGMGSGAYLLDYSYSALGSLGQAHRLSLTLKFGAES